MKALAAAVGALAFLGATAERAVACSLEPNPVPAEPRAIVADADAAFIGTLTDVTSPGEFGAMHVFTYRVEERLKGNLPERVEVLSRGTTAECGLPGGVGTRMGLVLDRRDGAWYGGLPDTYSPDYLRRGALPLPRPDGTGAARFVAGGSFGSARLATLDERGRVLAYGSGKGALAALSVCPGGRNLVELADVAGRVVAFVRRMPDLRIVREHEIAVWALGQQVVCRAATGSELLAVTRSTRSDGETRLLRVSAIGTQTVESARELSLTTHGGAALVSRSNGEIVAHDLATGKRRVVTRAAGLLAGASVSANGRFLAGFAGGRLAVVDLVRGTTKTAAQRFGFVQGAAWVGRRTLISWVGYGGSGQLETFDPSLRPRRPKVSWPAYASAVAGSDAYGVVRSGTLVRLAHDGTITTVRNSLFSPAVRVLIALPTS